MLGYEVLSYVCGIIGRVLLEFRERLPADKRFKEPWVVVLEEAHNYARPARQDEDRGIMISRGAFERIAKEGRKFGLSMIVANSATQRDKSDNCQPVRKLRYAPASEPRRYRTFQRYSAHAVSSSP